MYCLVEWKKTEEDCYEPNLPEDTGFVLLVDTNNQDFALFDCDLDSNNPYVSKLKQVSDELDNLIDSGKDFPPALAISRNFVETNLPEKYDQDSFLTLYLTTLREQLETQPTTKYFMAQAQGTEIGYMYSGSFYWIINYDPDKKMISWLSRDYFIYQNHISFFKVNELELRKRFSL